MKTRLLILLLISSSSYLFAQEFPKGVFNGEHHVALGLQFGEEESKKITNESETYTDAKKYTEEDLKAIGIEPAFTYIKAPVGGGSLPSMLKKGDARCILLFIFVEHPKKGGAQEEFKGRLELREVDENGRQSGKNLLFTIGDGTTNLPTLISELQQHIAE